MRRSRWIFRAAGPQTPGRRESLGYNKHIIAAKARGRLLDEVIPDLALLVRRYPREAGVWQTLGDALARAGDAEHASQSYSQARKLIH